MADLLGNEFNEFISCYSHPPHVGLRVNSIKIAIDDFANLTPFSLLSLPWCQSGFIVQEPTSESAIFPPGKHPYHSAGLYYLQEPSTMAAAEALAPQPGEYVLDLAAAPGGKTTHIASLMQNTGLLVANEIHPKRVWDLAENLERCGVTNAIVTNESPQKLADHFGEYFDRVMLDAPCSGEGMFRKAAIARKEWRLELPSSCATRQAAILEQASKLVKPGGFLAYTTCTFSTEENEGVIASFLERHREFQLNTEIKLPGLSPARPDWIGLPKTSELSQAMRIWPHKSPGEGHFIAILRKIKSMEMEKPFVKLKKIHETQNSLSSNHAIKRMFDEFVHKYLDYEFQNSQIFMSGSYVYQQLERAPELSRIKVIHPGWWLGQVQKERFTPSHALAMGICASQARQTILLDLRDDRLMAYIAGESINYAGDDGWVLVTITGYPIGWGKRVQNNVKNFYPHGLRRSINPLAGKLRKAGTPPTHN
jgi:NOL1/NOP2/sun family putative RNA methylase